MKWYEYKHDYIIFRKGLNMAESVAESTRAWVYGRIATQVIKGISETEN